MSLKINAFIEEFPIRGAFVISRERRTVQVVVRVTLDDGEIHGQGECVPYRHYGETPEGVVADILKLSDAISKGMTRAELQNTLPAGAARNGIDCALWDYEAKKSGRPAWQIAGLSEPKPVASVQTISLGAPEVMFEHTKRLADWPMLKIKLGGDGDDERIKAVHEAAPRAKLIADANEAWRPDIYEKNLDACLATNSVVMIEQPFPAAHDDMLGSLPRPIPVCADESLHDRHTLVALKGRYDVVNIKLDKAGGLTEALLLKQEARRQGFKIFVGSMVATSLAIAPALLLAQDVDFVDLDPPLLLEKDRENPIMFQHDRAFPASSALWG
ncbi:MAG: N-acetyl-D-Glu racemase DgcA [Pseudomonadota bacterium]